MRNAQMYRQLIPQLCKTGRYEKALLSIIIPVYEPTANLARTIWSIKQTIDVPCQVIVQIEKQSVAKNRNAGLAQATGEQASRHETTWELTYQVRLNEHVSIQPDIQYVRNPSLSPDLDDAWIVGCRLQLAY